MYYYFVIRASLHILPVFSTDIISCVFAPNYTFLDSSVFIFRGKYDMLYFYFAFFELQFQESDIYG